MVDLAKYKGKVLLIVNVASECGYTDQYKALQALHAKYGKDGLAILAFPCNDFGGQEPDNEAKIKEVCQEESTASSLPSPSARSRFLAGGMRRRS